MNNSTIVSMAALTNQGKVRQQNEDNFCVSPSFLIGQNTVTLDSKGVLLVVADGMGGAVSGFLASQIATEIAQQTFESLLQPYSTDVECIEYLKQIIFKANKKILDEGRKNAANKGMGTTMVLTWVIGSKAYIAWVGDSRCYHFQQSQPLFPTTNDHSMVWEEVMKGNLSPEMARNHQQSNLITQSLGDSDTALRPDTLVVQLRSKDQLLLCSDGLNGMLTDRQIQTILENLNDPSLKTQQLIAAANEAGGNDNITTILLEVHQTTNIKDEKVIIDGNPKTKNTLLYIGLAVLLAFTIGAVTWFNSDKWFADGTKIANNQPTPIVSSTPATVAPTVPYKKPEQSNIAEKPTKKTSNNTATKKTEPMSNMTKIKTKEAALEVVVIDHAENDKEIQRNLDAAKNILDKYTVRFKNSSSSSDGKKRANRLRNNLKKAQDNHKYGRLSLEGSEAIRDDIEKEENKAAADEAKADEEKKQNKEYQTNKDKTKAENTNLEKISPTIKPKKDDKQ
jgi:serine/threonine protein phosphatase PrpC